MANPSVEQLLAAIRSYQALQASAKAAQASAPSSGGFDITSALMSYAKPAVKLASSFGSKYITDAISSYLPSVTGSLPYLGAAIGPAITLAQGLAGGGGDKMTFSVPTAGMSAFAGPASGPLMLAQIGSGINEIFQRETAAERLHNVKERQGQAKAGMDEVSQYLAKAKKPEDLYSILRQPFGEAGTLGGVMRSMIEGNLSGKYLTPDTNMGGGEMYWEPNEKYRDLLEAIDKLGIQATPYAGNQGSKRINNINELIANSGGVEMEMGKYGPKAHPSEAKGIGAWDALLASVSQMAKKADPSLGQNAQPWEWTDERINQQVMGFDPSNPESMFPFYNEYKTNPFFAQNYSGTPVKAARMEKALSSAPIDENAWRQWRINSGYRDPDDIAFLNRNTPDYQYGSGGYGGD